MAWRVYLHGLLLLGIVSLAVGAVGAVAGRGPLWRDPSQVAAYASARAGELGWESPRMTRELEHLRDIFGIGLSLYAVDGTLLATNAQPPVPPLAPDEMARLVRSRAAGARWWPPALPLSRDGQVVAYLALGRAAEPVRMLGRAAAFIAAVLVALAVASFPLAHAIARPLERLTHAARSFGQGELSARSGLRRRDEIGELARAFDQMAERIERLVQHQNELLANVSHELRTPLARVRVALDLAEEGDAEKSQRYLKEIEADVGELEQLVADALTASRLELAAGKPPSALPLKLGPVDPGDWLDSAAQRFRAAHPARTLEVAIQGGLPPLEGDAGLLRRALQNALDNAGKYSEPPAPVRLTARREGDAVLIEVKDEGIGIDPEDLPHLFVPFFRTDRSRSRGTGGVGLGLALAKRIVEAHGGKVSVESAPGRGTTVRFLVPVSRSAPPVTSAPVIAS